MRLVLPIPSHRRCAISVLRPLHATDSLAPITKDLYAVRAAISSPWSNDQTEGHVNRLKLVNGRARLDLLEARLIGAP